MATEKEKTAFSINTRFIVKVDKDDDLKKYHTIISKMVDENESMALQSYVVQMLGVPAGEEE